MNPHLSFTRYPTTTGLSLACFFSQSQERRGIYVLSFTDGTEYVGQAVDILSRYRSHARRYSDAIVCIDFAPTPRLSLDTLELLTIRWRQENGARLRNRLLVGPVEATHSLDHWTPLTYPLTFAVYAIGSELDAVNRVERDTMELQPLRSFARLLERPDAQAIIDALAAYLHHVLPRPGLTEQRSWVVTAMPRSDDGMHRLAGLTIHNVQVLAFIEDNRRSTRVIMNVADRPQLDDRYGAQVVRYHPIHETMQRAQLTLGSAIDALYQDPNLCSAARRAASNLMHGGPSLVSRFHCFPLADAIYASAARRTGARI